MKRIIQIFLLVLSVVLLAACSRASDVSVLRYKVERIAPSSFRSAYIAMKLEICNKGPEISITDASGTLFAEDSPIGTFKIDTVTIAGHDTQWVKVECAMAIDQNAALLDVIRTLHYSSISKFTVSYELEAKSGIFSKTLKGEKVPLSNFVKK